MTACSPQGAPPAVSIVMPSYNCRHVIGDALESLARQTCRDFEVLISDGASRDSTLEVAAGYGHRLPELVLDSRPDGGIYDAINRVIPRSRGRWLYIMGADDRLHQPSTLAAFLAAVGPRDPGLGQWASCGSWDGSLVYGDVIMGHDAHGARAGARYTGALTFVQLLRRNICQQAVFYRRELYDDIGGFDCRYPVCADWDFHLRAAARSAMRWVDLVVADYGAAGTSAARADERFNADRPALLRELSGRFGHAPELRSARLQLLRDAVSLARRGSLAQAARSASSWWRQPNS